MEVAVKAPIADQAAVWPPTNEQIGQVDRAEMGSAKLFFFMAYRADQMRIRHCVQRRDG
jgi:hypothetical protein